MNHHYFNEHNMENFRIISLTAGWDFKVWPPAFDAGHSGKVSLDQLPIHKASIKCCPSIRVDVSYRFTGHLFILIQFPKYTAAILDTPQYTQLFI